MARLLLPLLLLPLLLPLPLLLRQLVQQVGAQWLHAAGGVWSQWRRVCTLQADATLPLLLSVDTQWQRHSHVVTPAYTTQDCHSITPTTYAAVQELRCAIQRSQRWLGDRSAGRQVVLNS